MIPAAVMVATVAEPVATTLPDPAQLAELAADAPAPSAQTLWEEHGSALTPPIASTLWLADEDPAQLARLRPSHDAPAPAEPWQNRLGSALQQSHPISAAHYLPVASAGWAHHPAAASTDDSDEHPIDISETVAAEEAPPADAAAVAPEPAGKTPIQLGENDRVLLISGGGVRKEGTHRQLLRESAEYRQLRAESRRSEESPISLEIA